MSSLNLRARGPLFTVMTSFLSLRACMMLPRPAPPVFTSVGLTSTRMSYAAASSTAVGSLYSSSPTLPVLCFLATRSRGSSPSRSRTYVLESIAPVILTGCPYLSSRNWLLLAMTSAKPCPTVPNPQMKILIQTPLT